MGRSSLCWGLVGVSFLIFLGCNGCSGRPRRVSRPPLDPSGSGRRAIEQYDTNGDKVLEKKEIQKCPALWNAMERVDINGDGQLTEQEITDRVQMLLTARTRLFGFRPRVTLDDVGLEGATVTLEPEKFLGDAFKPSTGVTDEIGDVVFKGPNKQFPHMIHPGFYRVRVSKMVDGKETIPAKYNTETTLGHEEAEDKIGVGFIEIKLESE